MKFLPCTLDKITVGVLKSDFERAYKEYQKNGYLFINDECHQNTAGLYYQDRKFIGFIDIKHIIIIAIEQEKME